MAEGNAGDPIPKSHLTQGMNCLNFVSMISSFFLLISSIQSEIL